MFNSVRETRMQRNGMTSMNLEMSEEDFFTIYNDLSQDVASDIVDQYLIYRGDDGRAANIQISHNPGSSIVSISANLQYLGNDKTDYPSGRHGIDIE